MLILTHPPVVFGPHRSPRGEGHLRTRHATFGSPSRPPCCPRAPLG